MNEKSRGGDEVYERARGNEVEDFLPELLTLHHLSFGTYPGVIPTSEAFLRWYLERPGLGEENTLLFLHEGHIVSSLFLTISAMYWQGGLVPVGIIDTVMIHPDHRKKGLASKLIQWAEEVMRERGCRMSLLYTLSDSPPFHLYRSLGYLPVESVFHLQYLTAHSSPFPFSPRPQPKELIRQFLNASLACFDGFVPLDEDYFAWRKVKRPPMLPAFLFTVQGNGMLSSLTLIQGEITTPTHVETVFYLQDFCGQTRQAKEELLERVLASLPPQSKVDTLCAPSNEEEWHLFLSRGFRPTLEEVALIHPLEGEKLELPHSRRPWYPLLESIVGA